MGAQSLGIPSFARDAGGVPEIVNPVTGWLLETDPAPGEVAPAIREAAHRSMETGAQIRQYWREHFPADNNYCDFVRALCELTSSNA
jgi:glycosyltransferase involved in cell wall biosynthesis